MSHCKLLFLSCGTFYSYVAGRGGFSWYFPVFMIGLNLRDSCSFLSILQLRLNVVTAENSLWHSLFFSWMVGIGTEPVDGDDDDGGSDFHFPF